MKGYFDKKKFRLQQGMPLKLNYLKEGEKMHKVI
jgi:hypothetical protein